MDALIASNYRFPGFHNSQCICHLQIKQTLRATYVCVTELADNPGTSITNAHELLREQIIREFYLESPVIFLERYTAESYHDDDRQEDVSIVEMLDGQPNWKPFSLSRYRQIFSVQ